MMSEEITKVMDEQRDLELEYAQLVQQRDQLKGISNKHKLMETKEAIMVSNPLQILNDGSYSFLRVISSQNLNIQQVLLTIHLFLLKDCCQGLEREHKEIVSSAAEEARCGGKLVAGRQTQEGLDCDYGTRSKRNGEGPHLCQLHAHD